MSDRLNTQDLIDLLVNQRGLGKKVAENFVKEFFLLIEEGLAKDRSVKIKGLGTFKLVDVGSRESVNVNTGERIEIQGHTKISFTPDTTLRDIINKPFAHFETVTLNKGVDFNDIAQDDNTESSDDVIEEKQEIVKEKAEEEVMPEEASPVSSEKEETVIAEEQVQTASDPNKEEVKETVEAATPIEEEEEEEESNNKTLMIVVVLTILLCGGLLFFTYYDDIFPENKESSSPITLPTVEMPTDSVAKDSIGETTITTQNADVVSNVASGIEANTQPEAKPDTLKKEEKTPVAPQSATTNARTGNTVPFSQIPVKPDSTGYDIVGTKTTHILKKGETLIRIAYRYYGTKDLYPYLIMHNRSVIKNPDSVPLGTVIKIPELRKK